MLNGIYKKTFLVRGNVLIHYPSVSIREIHWDLSKRKVNSFVQVGKMKFDQKEVSYPEGSELIYEHSLNGYMIYAFHKELSKLTSLFEIQGENILVNFKRALYELNPAIKIRITEDAEERALLYKTHFKEQFSDSKYISGKPGVVKVSSSEYRIAFRVISLMGLVTWFGVESNIVAIVWGVVTFFFFLLSFYESLIIWNYSEFHVIEVTKVLGVKVWMVQKNYPGDSYLKKRYHFGQYDTKPTVEILAIDKRGGSYSLIYGLYLFESARIIQIVEANCPDMRVLEWSE